MIEGRKYEKKTHTKKKNLICSPMYIHGKKYNVNKFITKEKEKHEKSLTKIKI